MKKIYEEVRRAFDSKIFLGILCGIGIIIVAILIFSAGITVGFHKASFGRAWGENYGRNFGMGPGRLFTGGENFPNANGAIGKIIKIDGSSIIVQDRDNTEKVVLLDANTQIEKIREDIKAEDLQVDDFVVVIGEPNEQGQINAKLIRVMPFGIPTPMQTEPMPPAGK